MSNDGTGSKIIGGIVAIAIAIGGFLAKSGDNILKMTSHTDDFAKIVKHADDFSKVGKHADDFSKAGSHTDDYSKIGKHADDYTKTGKSINDIPDEFAKHTDDNPSGKTIDELLKELKKFPVEADEGEHSDEIMKLELTDNGFKIKNSDILLSEIEIKKLSKNKPIITISGNLTEIHAKKLAKQNIKFVFNEDYLKARREKYDFTFIFAKHKNDDEVNDIFDGAANTPNVSIVDNEDELIKTINKANTNNKRPIIVFNNQNGLVYNKEINGYGVEDAITCNSSSIKGSKLTVNSTDYLNASDVVNAIKKCKSKTISKSDEAINLNQKLTIEETYLNFCNNYMELLKKRKQQNALIVVGIGTGTSGGVTGIIIINND